MNDEGNEKRNNGEKRKHELHGGNGKNEQQQKWEVQKSKLKNGSCYGP